MIIDPSSSPPFQNSNVVSTGNSPTAQVSINLPPSQEQPPPPVNTPVSNTSDGLNLKPQDPNITIQKTKRGSKFIIFIVILIVLTAIIYGVAAYLYLNNKKLQSNKDSLSSFSPTPSMEVKQQVTFKINNGSIYLVEDGVEKMILSKSDYPSTGIAGFTTVTASPNSKMVCFSSLPPALEPALFISNKEGTDVAEISKLKTSCVWSQDSAKVAYQDVNSETGNQDVFIYNIADKVETKVTSSTFDETARTTYSVGKWQDNNKLTCTVTLIDSSSNMTSEKPCLIDALTGQVQEDFK